MSICGEISADIERSCSNKPVAGIEQEIILINTKDLLATGITFDATNPNELMTALALESGKNGFKASGLKNIMNFGNSFEIPADAESGVIHSINNIRIQDNSVAAQMQINQFIDGAKVFAVVHRKWKGVDNANAFLFFGLKHGLEMSSDSVWNSTENNGAPVISLKTPEGYSEPYVPHQVLLGDYPATLTAFDNKFQAS